MGSFANGFCCTHQWNQWVKILMLACILIQAESIPILQIYYFSICFKQITRMCSIFFFNFVFFILRAVT